MENNQMEQERYLRAQKKVKSIKGFYTHLTIYIVVNIAIILINMGAFNGFSNIGMPSWAYFTTPFFWGIGLVGHGLYVFQHKFRFYKDWEERKIKEYMDREDSDFEKTERWD